MHAQKLPLTPDVLQGANMCLGAGAAVTAMRLAPAQTAGAGTCATQWISARFNSTGQRAAGTAV